MSVGGRLREERLRLGRTQADFAAIGGASKRALINWEQDVATPSVPALIAFGEAGADAPYILTGRRSLAIPVEQASLLDHVESWLRTPTETAERTGVPRDALFQTAKATLEAALRIADPAILSDSDRERVDLLLRSHFDDEAAKQRIGQRYASMMTRRQDADRDLQDALLALELDLPRGIHHAILQLVIEYQISVRDLMPLLAEFAPLFSRNRKVQLGDPVP